MGREDIGTGGLDKAVVRKRWNRGLRVVHNGVEFVSRGSGSWAQILRESVLGGSYEEDCWGGAPTVPSERRHVWTVVGHSTQ